MNANNKEMKTNRQYNLIYKTKTREWGQCHIIHFIYSPININIILSTTIINTTNNNKKSL